jgi:hypothetical protein
MLSKPFLKGLLKYTIEYIQIFEAYIRDNYKNVRYFDQEEDIEIPKADKVQEVLATAESILEYIFRIKMGFQKSWAGPICLPAAAFKRLVKAQMYYPVRLCEQLNNVTVC